MVTVALAQLDLTRAATDPATAPRPLAAGLAAVQEAAQAGAQLVVLPELWRTGPFELTETLGAAEALDGATATALSAIAAELGIWLHGGSILELAADGHRYNTSLVFDPEGALAATYRKRHLFGFDSGEAALIDSGDDIVVVDTPLGPTGLATCYDLRFPEHFRALVSAGAESVIVPAGWPAARIGHWAALAHARAIENQLAVLACNATGSSGGVALGGRSLVFDAWGEPLADAPEAPTVLAADVDPQHASTTRAEFPVLRDRRPD
ncbi:MAG: carbon-nitrogen family hydrolase [Candidatus Nanopelagicales bacterium]